MAASTSSTAANTVQFREAVFIDDVPKFLNGRTVDEAMGQLNEDLQMYKLYEQQLLHKRVRLLSKLPEIEKALSAVRMVMDKHAEGHDVVVDYQLADNVYAKARIKPVETVNLWLGANVMLEYGLDEAVELLETNVENCKRNLDTNKSDMDVIKDCVTTTQVSMARVYNYDVAQRRKAN